MKFCHHSYISLERKIKKDPLASTWVSNSPEVDRGMLTKDVFCPSV